jgi:hypothetical protein
MGVHSDAEAAMGATRVSDLGEEGEHLGGSF